MLRYSEYSTIRWKDLQFIPDVYHANRVRLHLPTEVDWFDLPAGLRIDPVAALVRLLRFKSLVTPLSLWLRQHPNDFVCSINGREINRKWLNNTLDRYAFINKTERSLLSGHSFRIGATTELHRNGASDSLIKMLGRWHSDIFLCYIRHDFENIAKMRRKYFN